MTRFWTAVFFTLIACRNPSPEVVDQDTSSAQKKIETASWLIGKWHSASKERTNYEEWTKQNDSVYVGRSYSIQHGDTVSSESVQLVQQGEMIQYIPTVQGQNNNMPVTFKLTAMDSDKLTFENQAHDFPQTITYRKVFPDSLIAEISGKIKGEYQAQKFPMRRVE